MSLYVDATPSLVALLERCAALDGVPAHERREFAAAARAGLGRQVAYDVVRSAFLHVESATQTSSSSSSKSTTSSSSSSSTNCTTPSLSLRQLLHGSTVRVGLMPEPREQVRAARSTRRDSTDARRRQSRELRARLDELQRQADERQYRRMVSAVSKEREFEKLDDASGLRAISTQVARCDARSCARASR